MERMPSSVQRGRRRGTVRALLGLWQRDAVVTSTCDGSVCGAAQGPLLVQEGPSMQAVLSLKVGGPSHHDYD